MRRLAGLATLLLTFAVAFVISLANDETAAQQSISRVVAAGGQFAPALARGDGFS